MIKGHGGNVSALAQKINVPVEEIVDMSSNLNPLGAPEIIQTILKDKMQAIRSLPDADAHGMAQAFCNYHGIGIKNAIAGNGTTWFIYTLALALKPSRALVLAPTYSDYNDACIMHGVDVEHYTMDPDQYFAPDLSDLSQKIEGKDMAFICNPNNPTGALISKESLLWLIKKHIQRPVGICRDYRRFRIGTKISAAENSGYRNGKKRCFHQNSFLSVNFPYILPSKAPAVKHFLTPQRFFCQPLLKTTN